MSEENDLSQTPPNPSASSHSSKWSISTSNFGTDTHCTNSITNYDTESQTTVKNGCVPLIKLLKSVFVHRRKAHPGETGEVSLDTEPNENNSFQHSILIKLVEQINLLDTFLNTSLLPKLKLYSEQTCYPHPTRSFEQQSLPSAEIWSAAYLLKLLRDSSTSNKEVDLAPYRKPLMSLHWDMEMTRRVGLEFYSKYTEFTAVINGGLRDLRAILQNYSKESLKDTQTFGLGEPLELNLKQQMKDKNFSALQVKSSLYLNAPLSFNVDSRRKVVDGTNNTNSNVNQSPKDFVQLENGLQENIIFDLIKHVSSSLETGCSVMESSTDRIISRGIIIKGAIQSKDVTCHSLIKDIRQLLEKLVCKRKTGLRLNEPDELKLVQSLGKLFSSWSTYTRYAQGVILKFFELCDVISISYGFAFNHVQLNISPAAHIQREVDLAVIAYNRKVMPATFQCPCGKSNLKHYAINSLLEKCNQNQKVPDGFQQQSETYLRLMKSTRYHLLLQQYPLELEDRHWKYVILLRSQPDFEKVDKDMVLSSRWSTIDVRKGIGDNVIDPNIFENAPVQTFNIHKYDIDSKLT